MTDKYLKKSIVNRFKVIVFLLKIYQCNEKYIFQLK